MEKKKTTKKVATRKPAKRVVAAPKKKVGKNGKAGIIGLCLIVLALAISVGTFSYYQTTITGTASGNVLSWLCTANNEDASFELSLGELYPGKTGSWLITLGVENFEATYTVSLSNPSNVDDLVFTNTTGGNTVTLCHDGTTQAGVCQGSYNVVVDGTSGSGSGSTTINYSWPGGTAGSHTSPVSNLAAGIKVNIVCTQNARANN